VIPSTDSKRAGSESPSCTGEFTELEEVERGNSDVSLRRLEASESQEQLRPSRAKSAMYVTRTTYIDVSSVTNSADPEKDLKKDNPWEG